jgi:26S proteasome regulatory subunit N3
MPDVEMKLTETDKLSDKKNEEDQKPSPPSILIEIKNNVVLLERAVSTLEPRFTHRVLRTLTALRKRINDTVLREAIELIYAKGDFCFIYILLHRIETNTHIDNASKEYLLSWLTSPADQSMEVDSADKPNTPELVVVPEAEMYLRLLVLYHLLTSEDTHEKALELANETVEKMQALNRRSMDAIAAKIWFAVDQAYELAGELSDARP